MFLKYVHKLPLVALSFFMLQSASAHEFWIEPLNFEVANGESVRAHIKVGQMMDGETYSFFPGNFERFDITVGGNTQPVANRFAQSPAVDQLANQSGLTILTYQSKASVLTYSEPGKFESFLKNEGIEWVLAEHKRRGLPAVDFVELFKRFGKSLVKVGDGAGQDQVMGMPIEWVVETNPYTDKGQAITAQLLYQGKPFADSYVVVFNKRNGEVVKSTYRTDQAGRVSIPKGEGGVFLVNAVQMIQPTAEQAMGSGAVWMSLWASTTYEIKPSL